MSENKNIDINLQWLEYLKKVGVTEEMLPEVQKQEMKRTFYGAWGQLLVLMRDKVSEIEDEDESVEVLMDMMQQVVDFWDNEVEKANKN